MDALYLPWGMNPSSLSALANRREIFTTVSCSFAVSPSQGRAPVATSRTRRAPSGPALLEDRSKRVRMLIAVS